MPVGQGGTYSSCLPRPSSSPSTVGLCLGTAAPPWPPRAGGTPGMLLSTIKAAEMPQGPFWGHVLEQRAVGMVPLKPGWSQTHPSSLRSCSLHSLRRAGGCW